MAKYLHIQVADPCQEKWESMKPICGGAFCNACQKEVRDFTQMTDNQIIEFFQKQSGNLCGRFTQEQLNKEYPMPVKKIPWMKYFFGIYIPAMLLSMKSEAQRFLKKEIMAESHMYLPEKENKPVTRLEVKGTVMSERGHPAKFITVMMEGTNEGTTTDENGVFSIRVRPDTKYLLMSGVGYETKRISLQEYSGKVDMKIVSMEPVVIQSTTLGMSTTVVYAGMTSVRVSRRGKKIPPLMPLTTSRPAFDVFPNPAGRNDFIGITLKNTVQSDQQLVILDAQGKIHQQEVVQVTDKTKSLRVQLNLFSSGTFYIRLTDAVTRQSITTPLTIR